MVDVDQVYHLGLPKLRRTLVTDKQFKYLTKLIVIMGVCTVGLSMAMTSILLEINLKRMSNTTKILTEWSQKADFANQQLNEMYRVNQIKESYQQQGIGAEEVKDINKNLNNK